MNKHPHLNNQDTHVYMWESPSRKRYVGVTNNIERRLQEYRKCANAGAQWPIHRAIRKYGDQMKFTVLFTETGEGARIRALDAEAFLVDFGDFDLNAAPGGQESPSTLPEVAKKISDATRLRMRTTEARERTSLQSKARWATQDYREKMANVIRSEISQSSRDVISAAQKKRFALGVGTSNLSAAREKQMKAVICIESGQSFSSMNEAARWLQENGSAKADVSAITRAAKGKVKTAYGFTWKFLKEE